MKIRTGFVSNSSSSSFIILGKSLNSINEIDLEKGKYIATGEWLNEGLDIFYITKENINAVKYLKDRLKLYQVYSECGNGSSIKSKDLPEVFNVYDFTQDQNSCSALEDILEIYNIEEKDLLVFERQDKLKQINEQSK